MTKLLSTGTLVLVLLLRSATTYAADAEHVFTVAEGAFPWFDRVGQWSLTNVPDSVKGSGPLPQGDCSSRSLVIAGHPASITVGVQTNDAAKFTEKVSGAKDTGAQIAVKNPAGVTLAYSLFSVANPPAKIDGTGVFGAGLILLKVEGGEPAADSPSSSVAPSPSASPTGSVDASPGAATSTATEPAVSTAPAPTVTAAAPKAFVLCEKSKLQLYLLIGQSNMVGRDTAGLDQQVEDANIGYLSGDDSHWFIAREPMHAGGSGIGPGLTFAQEMLHASPGIKIGLIPCAVGGTPLSRWVKGSDLYAHALKRARAAMNSGELKGILWHQGESDSNSQELAQSYATRLEQMFRDLRQDLGRPEVPIVVGQLGEFVQGPYVKVVSAALAQVPLNVAKVGLADSKRLSHKGDSLHFSSAAQQEFGKRYAAAMLALQAQSVSE